MSKEKYRSRVHMVLLYPDNPSHCEALEKIKASYDYAACLHNKDKMDDGTDKKDHWHVVIRFSQAKWNTAICKELGIEDRFIEDVKKFDNALQYLIHYNDDNKAQYSIDEVFGNLKSKLQESINKGDKTEGEKVVEILEVIEAYDGRWTITDFAKFCAMNGYWSEFRRSGAIFVKILEEHNQKYMSNCHLRQIDDMSDIEE